MAHLRQRHCLKIAQRKLRISPILAIQGMRQTGKCTFARQEDWLSLTLERDLHQIAFLSGRSWNASLFLPGHKGGIVDLVIERRTGITAIKLLSTESLDERELQGLLTWKKKTPDLNMFALGGLRAACGGVEIFPWNALG